MQSHEVAGGGVTLRVDETGRADGRSILFVHGFSQSRLSWDRQLHSDLADDFRLVAMDLRGHGGSEKPRDAYDDPERWADDVRSVIDALDLGRPILVGWSFGGTVVSDYLEVHGEDDVAGVNLVGSRGRLGNEVLGDDTTELVPGLESTDAHESVEALEAFVRLCLYDDPPPQDLYYLLGFNAVVPPYVREQVLARERDGNDDVLAALDLPVLITHGEEDAVVLPAATEHYAGLVPNAEVSWYPGVGHSPFWEAPERFNRELAEFVSRVSG